MGARWELVGSMFEASRKLPVRSRLGSGWERHEEGSLFFYLDICQTASSILNHAASKVPEI